MWSQTLEVLNPYDAIVNKEEREKKMNIVFIRHTNSCQAFLFEVPDGISLKEKEEVVVQTKRGETTGMCVCDSFEVGEKALQALAIANGAKLPLKQVVGRICVERFSEEHK